MTDLNKFIIILTSILTLIGTLATLLFRLTGYYKEVIKQNSKIIKQNEEHLRTMESIEKNYSRDRLGKMIKIQKPINIKFYDTILKMIDEKDEQGKTKYEFDFSENSIMKIFSSAKDFIHGHQEVLWDREEFTDAQQRFLRKTLSGTYKYMSETYLEGFIKVWVNTKNGTRRKIIEDKLKLYKAAFNERWQEILHDKVQDKILL